MERGLGVHDRSRDEVLHLYPTRTTGIVAPRLAHDQAHQPQSCASQSRLPLYLTPQMVWRKQQNMGSRKSSSQYLFCVMWLSMPLLTVCRFGKAVDCCGPWYMVANCSLKKTVVFNVTQRCGSP